MSKSYGNTIPLFLTEKKLKKHINKINTNLLEPGEPKDPDTSAVFQIWQAFASKDQTQQMRTEFANGIAWGEAKRQLFELVNEQLREPREKYLQLLENPAEVEAVLQQGAQKARQQSSALIANVRKAVGIRPLG